MEVKIIFFYLFTQNPLFQVDFEGKFRQKNTLLISLSRTCCGAVCPVLYSGAAGFRDLHLTQNMVL